MNIVELKNEILENTLNIDLLVLNCEGQSSHFIVDQYVEKIVLNNGFTKKYISDLNEAMSFSSLSLVDVADNILKIYTTDTLKDTIEDWTSFKNTIIICDKIDKKLLSKISENVVDIPKLVTWQIEDYIKTKNNKIDQTLIKELITLTSENIYRIDNELDKVNLFEDSPNEILQSILYEKDSDFFYLSTFDFVNSLVAKDIILVKRAMNKLKYWDSDPMFILSLLLTKYKQICLIIGNPKLNCNDLGLSPKQFNAIKYYYRGINLEEAREKIKFLSSIDLRLKLGKIGFEDQSYFLTYIVNNILT